MKWFLLIWCMIFSVVFGLQILSKHDLPQISLPKEAHNLVGNIPIIEMLDDGPNYINQTEIKFCDETWPIFSCKLRFGYSSTVSNRIAQGKLLDSCEEAKKVQEENLEWCIQQAKDLFEQLPHHLYGGMSDSIQWCYEEHQYLPECDKEGETQPFRMETIKKFLNGEAPLIK